MAKKKHLQSFKSKFQFNFYFALIFTVIAFLFVIGIGVAYFITHNIELFNYIAISIPFIFINILIMIYSINKKTYNTLYTKLYQRTIKNFKSIYTEKNKLDKYDDTEFIEFKELNEEIDHIGVYYSNVNILNNYGDYSRIPLEYYSKEDKIVTETSFRTYIKEIIAVSQSFRNAVVQISYDFEEKLDNRTLSAIFRNIKKIFPQYGLLIAPFDALNGLFVYIPKMSSNSFLKENLDALLDKLTVTIKTINGLELYSPKLNTVIYPYSPISNIFSDLRYISNQSERVSIYIPKRLSKQKNDSLLHSTMNINAMNLFLSELSSIAAKGAVTKNVLKDVNDVLKDIIDYLSIDQAGVVVLDDDTRKYNVATYTTLVEKAHSLFPVENHFNELLLDSIENNIDTDGTYFFSNRGQVNKQLGRYLDIYAVNSGFFYFATFDGGRHKILTYFVNTADKDLILDSYIRESLLMCSTLVTSILSISAARVKIGLMKSREDNLYKVTGIKSYNVNKNTYEILNYSSSLKELIPNIEIGSKCYNAIFGINKPCKNCPLTTNSKILKEINGVKSEISFSVNNKLNNQVELLVKETKEGEMVRNRFEADYGINSLYALNQRLEDLYLTKSKGYVLLISLDNQTKLVKQLGNEGYLMLFRLFAEDVSVNILHSNEIYLFKNDSFAVVLPEMGKLDVIDIIEEIYALSKKDYLHKNAEIALNFAYSAIRFPQSFANASDFLRNIEKTIIQRDVKKLTTDSIYVEENDFYRPASRKEYILGIINDAVKNDKFIIKAQPIVNALDKHIDGSELLIRLSDTYRDSMLNTDELIKIAGENNKLNLISDLLIKFICDAYSKYGSSLFKSNRFSRISINANLSYFFQENFFNNLKTILAKYKIPNGFMAFEITEADLASRFIDFKEIIPSLKQLGCTVVCDRYSGQFLSVEKLNTLDIDDVKVDRKMVEDIDVISEKFEILNSLLKLFKTNSIKTCVVGVENGQQYKLLKDANTCGYMQGYYFYHPLDVKELVEALRHKSTAEY